MSKWVDVTILLDRSGSMNSCRQATVEGINDFIKTVNADPGEGHWTFLQFDDRDHARGAGEEFPHAVFSHLREYEVPLVEEKDFIPRGGTALVDAVCATVHRIKDWYLSLPKEGQPRVLIVIVTDGQENSSKEHTTEQMRELLGEVQGKLKFEFVFLGANQDAFHEATSRGIQPTSYQMGDTCFCNVVDYNSTPEGMSVGLNLGALTSRAWKAEGNETGDQFLSSAQPGVIPDWVKGEIVPPKEGK